jgi:small nuclear ribonucleoprotein (snRNP)-like protein
VKQKAEKIEKYLMTEVEPLISSIIEATGQTEEWICKQLEYNDGYISQLRSRENRTNEPQVSPKFFNQLMNLVLQNANSTKKENTHNKIPDRKQVIEKGPVSGEHFKIEGHTSTGQIVYVDAKDLAASFERIIEEKEARRLEALQWAERAEGEKKDLMNIVKDYLREILANSVNAAKTSSAVEVELRSGHSTIMNALDDGFQLPKGTTATKSGNVEIAAHVERQRKDKKAGAGK